MLRAEVKINGRLVEIIECVVKGHPHSAEDPNLRTCRVQRILPSGKVVDVAMVNHYRSMGAVVLLREALKQLC